MNMSVRKLSVGVALAIGVLTGAPAHADLATCENVYVGRIWVERGHGLRAVVLLNTPEAGSGSLWMYFDNWTADEKKSALATLTAAKISGHRINVTTDEVGGCGVTMGGTQAKMVYLSTNP
jgi:hypothetical protein